MTSMLGISKVWMKWDILGRHVYLFPCPCCKHFGKRKKEACWQPSRSSVWILYTGLVSLSLFPTQILTNCICTVKEDNSFLLFLFESGDERPWARALAKVHGFIDHRVCHVKNNLYPSGVMPLGRSRHMNTWEEGARGREICVTPQS